ncbi:hypothetical protein [Phenylobacterium montanum]|uniref:Uncharacterized protein n=1 Tax=Phenylobacterium montanum TaxID=2823693 RepID=A0A975IUD8_9CAUL|nr:hypothetical protein [Caulobacter sp. S6]QUD87419.1 hypothetical protein KCG34_20565 [Caulobacter sp. S6]
MTEATRDGVRSGAANKTRVQGLAAACAGLVCAAVATASIAAPAFSSEAAKAAYLQQHRLNVRALHPHYLSKPPHVNGALRRMANGAQPGTGLTIPFWTSQITSPLDGNTYTYSMVGSNPYSNPHNTNVSYVPVVLRIHVGGFVLDPTQVSHCDTQSPATRFFNSPLFVANSFTSNGVNVSAVPGGTQLISAFQRANYWNAVKGSHYGVTLVSALTKPIVVDWTPTNPSDTVLGVSDNCGGTVPIALVEINELDAELQAIAAAYAQPAQIPVTLVEDAAVYIGTTDQCCVLGYHNAISTIHGTQTYAVGAYYDTNNVFGPDFADITIWSHELGELIDDPFVQSIAGAPGGYNNGVTPNWGYTGQDFGCQGDSQYPANLEDGDPLTPDQMGNFHNYPVVGVGGFVYHFQDLAFHDWFYRTASTSAGGKGSFMGNFAGGGQPTICQ